MDNFRLGTEKRVQWRRFNKKTSEGKICEFLQSKTFEVLTPKTLYYLVAKINRNHVIDALQTLSENEVVYVCTAKKMKEITGNGSIFHKNSKITLDVVFKANPLSTVVLNSFCFFNQPYENIDRYIFDDWNYILEKFKKNEKL